MQKCPKCGFEGDDGEFRMVTRNAPVSGMSMVDVGFMCPKCEFQFGFEGIER